MISNAFAKNIKLLRETIHMSQPEFARLISERTGLDITRSAISMWELGKRVPKMDLVVEIANIFNLSADDLLGTKKATYELVLPDPPQITMIARAGKRMSEDQLDLMLKWAQLTFPDAFNTPQE